MLPKHLSLKNFLSHNKSDIDFEKFDSALILGSFDNEIDQSNGSGKCLSGNTIITNPITGDRMKIKNIKNIDNLYVNGLDENLKLSPSKVIAIQKSGVKKMLKITLSNGVSETVSDTHPVLTDNAILKAKDLNVDDFVACPRVVPVYSRDSSINIGRARLLALYLAEGGTSVGGMRFTNNNKEIIEQAKFDIMEQFGMSLQTSPSKIDHYPKLYDKKNIRKSVLKRIEELGYDIKSIFGKNTNRALALKSGASLERLLSFNDVEINKLAEKQFAIKYFKDFLNEHGIMYKKSIHKRLPKTIFKSNRQIISAFLGTFWSCDGFVSDPTQKGKKEVSICLGSELLINDIQALLRRFGIISIKRYKQVDKTYDSWVLTVSSYRENLVKLHNLIGDYLVDYKKERFEKILNNDIKYSNPNIDVIPPSLFSKYIIDKGNFVSRQNKLTLSSKGLSLHSLSRRKLNEYAEYFDSCYLKKLVDSDLIWLKVKSIEKVEDEQTYDIQIDNSTKLYALDGFITHNSTIFESISWSLFGKSRHKKKNGVIKWDKKACEVEFDFYIGPNLYKIKRTRDKTIGDSTVYLGHWDGAQFNDISADTKTATDKKITELIGISYDVFVNSVYFKQNDISMFAQSTPSKRKDILKSLLRMEIWDAYQKKARDRARELSSKIDAKSINVVSIENIEKEIEVCKESLSELRKQIKQLNNEYTQLSGDLVNKKLEFNSVCDLDIKAELKKLQSEYTKNCNRLNEIKQKRENNNKTIASCNSQINSVQQKIRFLRDKIKQAKDIDIVYLRSKTSQGETKEKVLKDKISSLEKKLDLKDVCNVCKKPLTKKEISEINSRREKELCSLVEKHKVVKEKLQRAIEKLKEKEDIVSEASKAEVEKGKQELKLLKLRTTLAECESSNKRLDQEEPNIDVGSLKSEITRLKKLSDSNGVEAIRQSIETIESRIAEVKKGIDKLNVEYGSKSSRKSELEKSHEDQSTLQKDLNKLKGEHAVYDKLRLYFGKDGIQSVIIENVIEELENHANDLLTKICNDPMSVSIKTQKQNDNGSWVETFDIEITSGSRTDDFETYSGGEGFRVSLALRLALSNILATRMGGELKFLLLDEVGSSLDTKGLDMFIDIIKKLSTDMKILIITHDDKLKDKFDNVIMVNKGADGSKAELK
jgi:DNA repair exonuclease SbcCD ATPase subunit